MVRHQVPLYYLRLLLHRKLVKYLPKMPSQYPEYPLFTFLRDEHYVVLTIPPRVAQTLVLFHRESPSHGTVRTMTVCLRLFHLRVNWAGER